MPPAIMRILLLQIREQSDPMLIQERFAFAEALDLDVETFLPLDLLYEQLTPRHLHEVDLVMIGGSGKYSATSEEDWLYRALDSIRLLYDSRKPTFASCWGFQAVCRALGGSVVTDLNRAEVGSIQTNLTEEGRADRIFGACTDPFYSFLGHQDIVTQLPAEAILLASTDQVENQAITFPDRLFYATQFHPELSRPRFLERVEAYPEYVERIYGISYDEFERGLSEAPEMASLLKRFVKLVQEVSV
ncbi:MAG: type 1 glutamine amidotransferase [Planctomycetaceae bacterium]|nr:type 1 glutamine amidotransferase [Planctomycetaceae bacterium]